VIVNRNAERDIENIFKDTSVMVKIMVSTIAMDICLTKTWNNNRRGFNFPPFLLHLNTNPPNPPYLWCQKHLFLFPRLMVKLNWITITKRVIISHIKIGSSKVQRCESEEFHMIQIAITIINEDIIITMEERKSWSLWTKRVP